MGSEEEEEERSPARSSSSLRTAALRAGSGVLALPFPLSDFEGVCVPRCADGLWVGGRIRSEVQAVPLRGGIVIVTVNASDGDGKSQYLSRRRNHTRGDQSTFLSHERAYVHQ